MKNTLLIFLVSCFFATSLATAQEEELKNNLVVNDTAAVINYEEYNPLAPAKAAFYSAVLPGLGQAYNKSYWKIPIIYGGMGASMYFYSFNQTKYHEYRDAYKDLLAGRELTGELAGLDADRLIRAQRFHQRNRDLSLLITVGIYILNIVEANVDAHLTQFNVDENLSLKPQLQQNLIDKRHNFGLTLSYQF